MFEMLADKESNNDSYNKCEPCEISLEHSYTISSSEISHRVGGGKTESPFYRTKWCRYNKDKCPRGDNCRYAHNTTELITRACVYNQDCMYVNKIQDNTYINNGKHICRYKHPSESDDSFNERTDMKPEYKEDTTEIIRVRQQLVLKSVEIALQNGKRNIHIEVL